MISLARMIKFIFLQCLSIIKNISNSPEGKHYCIGVGSFIEPITALTARLVCALKNQNLITVAWIRGVLTRESSNRHNSFVMGLMAFAEKFALNRSHHVISNGKDTQEVYAARGVSSSLLNNAIPLEPTTILLQLELGMTRDSELHRSLERGKGLFNILMLQIYLKENMTKHQ